METICMKCKSCFLEEWEKYFKMSSVENFTQSVRRYGLHKQIAHWSVHGKTYNKTCTKRLISLHTLILHISSLIRAFANRMYLIQSLGLTKRLVRPVKTHVNLPTAILIKAFADVCTLDSWAIQSGINSAIATAHSDQTLCGSYSMHLLWTPGYPITLLYLVGRCWDWSESLLVARILL